MLRKFFCGPSPVKMQALAVLTGAAALYLGMVTLLKRQVLNTLFLAILSVASAVTVIGIRVGQPHLVAVTHYLFIFLVYFGSVFVTGYAVALVAILSAVALFTRVYYGKCIFSEAYKETGDRNVLNDLTYIAPLIVIALRIFFGVATATPGRQTAAKLR